MNAFVYVYINHILRRKIAYPRCVLHEIRSTAALVDALRVDAMLNGQFGLRHQIVEVRIVCNKWEATGNNQL